MSSTTSQPITIAAPPLPIAGSSSSSSSSTALAPLTPSASTPNNNHNHNASSRPVLPPDELLATIVELRLGVASGGSSQQQQKGQPSTNGGQGAVRPDTQSSLDTLDLCHKRIQDIPDEMAEVIKDEVIRLALGYNLIHSLPGNFASLNKLRYLNIRHNSISMFPPMLADMPSLEILDVSRNKLKRLPNDPGHLLNLKVLCISTNRLRKLPTWMASMPSIRILKTEGNPLEWPPPQLSILPTESAQNATPAPRDDRDKRKNDDRQMQADIARLKKWIANNSSGDSNGSSRAAAAAKVVDVFHHERGKSSTASSLSMVGSTGTVATSPTNLSAQDGFMDASTHSASNSISFSKPTDSIEVLSHEGDPDVSISSSATSAQHSSPERSFRMRPLVLSRYTGQTGPPTTAISQDGESPVGSSSNRFVHAGDQNQNGGSPRQSPSSLQSDAGAFIDHSSPSHTQAPAVTHADGSQFAFLAPSMPNNAWEGSGMPSPSLPSSDTLTPGNIAASPSRSITPTPHTPLDPTTPMYTAKPPMSAFGPPPLDEPLSPKSLTGPSLASAALQPALDLKEGPVRIPSFNNPRPAPAPPGPSRLSMAAHGRNNSHSYSQNLLADSDSVSNARKKLLKSKKSLPDLRSTDVNLSREQLPHWNQGASPRPSNAPSTPKRPGLPHAATADVLPAMPLALAGPPVGYSPRKLSAPASAIAVPAASDATRELLPAATVGPVQPKALARATPERRASGRRKNSALHSDDDLAGADSRSSRDDLANQQVQRDSYFKRLSTFPMMSAASSTPPSVLKTVDATRGILFALSQIFTALKQYTMFATDDRIRGQFGRVLDVSGGTLAALIDSLDRFDSLSLRGQVTAEAISAILFVSQDSVQTFRKVVSVLQLQLRTLQKSADVRYTRALVLMLYGAMTEVSNSWHEITQCADNVAVLEDLSQGIVGGASKEAQSRPPPVHVPAPGVGVAGTLPSIAESTSPISAKGLVVDGQSAIGATPNSARGTPVQPRPQRKRHAGSFSAQDVRNGSMMLPAGPDFLTPSANTPGSTPARRGQPRRGAFPAGPVYGDPATSFSAASSAPWPSASAHHNSSKSVGDTSAGMSTTFGSPSYAMSSDALPPPPAGVGMSAPASATKFTIGNPSRLPKVGTAQATAPRAYQYQQPGDGSELRPGYGGEALNPPASAPAHALYMPKPTIDHHLLSLIQQVTSTASGVWVALLEHLASLSVRGQHSSAHMPFSSGAATSSPESTPTLAATRTGGRTPMDSAGARSRTPAAGGASANLSPGPARHGGDISSSALSRQGSASPSVMASPSGALSPQPPQSMRKLVELREQCLSAAELTRRLQHTLEKVQDELEARAGGGSDLPAGAEAGGSSSQHPSSASPNPGSNLSLSLNSNSNSNSASGSISPGKAVDVRRLLDESVAFARAVTALLMQIKALSISHEGLTQSELRRALGALTSGCANLSVHLHFCAPYASGTRANHLVQSTRVGTSLHDIASSEGYTPRAAPVRAMTGGVGRPE